MNISQKDKILGWLLDDRSITPEESVNKWRCWRLAARINELRDYGWDIETEMINKNGVSYAKYRMLRR